MKSGVMPESGGHEFTRIKVVPTPVRAVARDDIRRLRIFRGVGGFEVAVPQDVIERMHEFARRAAPNECMGKLATVLGEDEQGVHVLVVGAVLDEGAVGTPAYIETSGASEFETCCALERLYAGATAGGWFHSHVRIGASYSATDRKSQGTWNFAHAIGLVVDPWSAPHISVYRGPEAERLSEVTASAPSLVAEGDRLAETPGPKASPAPAASPPSGKRVQKARRLRIVPLALLVVSLASTALGALALLRERMTAPVLRIEVVHITGDAETRPPPPAAAPEENFDVPLDLPIP